MAPVPGQIYEAIVMNGAPDPVNLPGHIIVRIPELYGSELDCPYPIPPLFPGWTAGGWHSVPSEVNPSGADEYVMVLVQYLGPQTFRWIGTSQGWEPAMSAPGVRSGTRSGDSRHSLYLDSNLGVFAVAGVDGLDTKSFLKLGTDGIVQMQGAGGGILMINATQFVAISPNGHALAMDGNGVVLIHKDGVASLSLRDGDVAALSASAVQISGGTIEMGGGAVPPIHPYVLSLTFLADLALAVPEIIAVGVLAGVPTMPKTSLLLAAITTSLGVGPPYLSTRITGD